MNPVFESLFGTDNLEEYVSGVFSDELDKLGWREQVSSGWQINAPRHRLFGRVRTLKLETIETDDERIGMGLGFLASLSPGDVLVVEGSMDYAYFGELMTRLSVEIGLAGAVIDGLTRDTFYTQTASLPVFARGYSPKDIKGRGRVQETDGEVNVDGRTLRTGDYVFGDSDALVFVPEGVMGDLRPKVLEAIQDEATIKRRIAEGQSVAEILRHHAAF
ncbi:MAG: RraA family protein [Pseudomonadota bacterium]